MARKKVQLRYIEDAAARKASFRKRRQGLLKKVQELSILCDVVACVIVYGEDPTELLVQWPGDRADVERALGKHQACPDMERWKRTVTREGYVEERIEKYTEQLKKLGQSIHEMEMYHLMQLVYLDGKSHGEFTVNELKSLRAFAGERVKELERRAGFLLEIGNVPLAFSVSDNFPGFPRMFKQGNPSVANNGLQKEEIIHLHPLNDEGSEGGGITTSGPHRFPGGQVRVRWQPTQITTSAAGVALNNIVPIDCGWPCLTAYLHRLALKFLLCCCSSSTSTSRGPPIR